MELTNQPNRTLYFDILRILATFAVIFVHSACSLWDMDNFNFDWNMRNVYDSAGRWCVPIFVMISGALFLNPEKHISIKKLYSTNIVRIITAFLFWSTIYVAYDYIINCNYDIKSILNSFIYGPFHFWFLFMIVGIYIAIPILKQITTNRSIMQYFLIISFIFTFALPTIANTIALIIPHSIIITSLIQKMDLSVAVAYSGYFILGHYLNSEQFKHSKIINILGLVGFFLIAVCTTIHHLIWGGVCELFYSPLSLFVLFEAIAAFLFVKNLTPRIKFSTKAINMITKISNMCFGIYLVHILVLWLLSHYGISTNKFSTIISIPTISILVFAISLFISSCLYKIPFCRKYMM